MYVYIYIYTYIYIYRERERAREIFNVQDDMIGAGAGASRAWTRARVYREMLTYRFGTRQGWS